MLLFGNAIRSRLSSLLQPWLQQMPDMDIELGLLTSNLRFKNLCLDHSALNHLIDGSSRLVFERVTVRNLNVRVAPLKFPAFSIEVSGVDVVLSLRDLERERCFIGPPDLEDLREREMKSMLSLLDPEGVSLHETVSKISAIHFPRNVTKTATMKTILECCHLQAQDILFELQLPPMDDSNAFFFRVKELSVESEHVDYSSLLRGLVDAMFVPYKESSFVLNSSSLEVDLKSKDRVSRIACSRDVVTHFHFKNLLPININVHASQLQFSSTAVDLSVLLVVFDLPSSTEIKCARTGRELWNMAVWRIGCLKPNPCRSLRKLFMTAVIWLRHIHAYESLLLLLGYSSIDQFKLNADRMTRDRSFSASIKHQMKVVSDLEKELPVEAIERARRVARYRAAVRFHCGDLESVADIKSRSFMRILALVSFLWKITCQIYYSMMHSWFSLKNVLNYHHEVDGASPPLQRIDSYTQHRFALDIEELSITLSPERAAHDPKKGNLQSDVEQSELSLCSFHVVFRTFCLTYSADSISQSLCLVCKDLKIFSLLSGLVLRPSNSKIKPHRSFGRHRLEEDSESKVLLWSEPACRICPSERVVDAMHLNSNIHTYILDRYIGEMWSDWMSSSNNVEEDKLEYFDWPFLLGNVKRFLLDPYFHGSECGLSKCSLTLGKLNIDLEYMSLMSLALLLRQIHDSYNWITTNGRTEVLSHISSISEEKTEVKGEDLCESYANKIKMGMLNMIPQNMQIGVTIAGSSIQISMQGLRWQGSKEHDLFISEGCSGCSLTINIESAQAAIWPSKKSVIAALTGEPIFNEAATEYLWLMEPQPTDVRKAGSNENFTSYGRIALGAYLKFNGVNAIIEDLAENFCSHVVGLLPVEMKSSFCRDYSHSFTTTTNALSMKINGTARGADALFYVDELCVFHQVFEDILSAVSRVSLSFDSISDAFLENLYRRNGASAIRDVRGNLLAYEAKCKSLILKSTKFIVDVTLEFDTLDIIMDGSRGNHTIRSCRKANGASSSVSYQIISPTKYGKTMHAMVSLPKFGLGMSAQRSFIQISPEGGFLKVLFIVSGIRSIIFGGQSHTGKYSDVSEVRKLLHESVNCLYESYLSSCTFVISTGPHEGFVLSGRIRNTVDAYGAGGSQPSVTAETSDCPELIILQEGSEFQSGNDIAPTGLLQPASSCWFFVEIGLDELFILEPSRKDVILGVHQANTLQISLSIGKEFRTVSCEIQDGLFVLETAALATFIECFREYILFITNFSNISSGRPYETDITLMVKNEGLAGAAGPSDGHSKEDFIGAGSLGSPLAACNTSLESKWKFPMNLSLGLSKLSLVLVAAEGSGETSELVLEADFHFMLELFNSRTKLLFNLSRLSIVSQNMRALHQTTTGILVPHFQSNLSDHSSPPAGYYQHSRPLQHTENILPVVGDAYPRGPSGTENENFEGGVSGFYRLIPGSDIVKGITASITVEKAVPSNESLPYQMNNDWVGSGSVSGFNLTITLSEIEMILALFTPLFGVSSRATRGNVKEKFGSRYQEQDSVSENTIPDGAVVAIKDLHQHMYFAVESVENKYRLVGAIHYSLAGERALFRVKYHKQWRWRRNVSWFSLISLHAKTNAGEPLRLNFCRGSDFVDVSSTDDTGWALWGRLSYKPESNEGDNFLESYNQLAQKAFYLVNKKNDCGVAFIDGLPEFVKKPGHPFKVKLFHDFSPMQEIRCLNVPYTHIDRRSETNSGDSFSNVDNNLNFSPYINIRTGNITLTVLHEISEVNDRFPLLCGRVIGFQFNVLVTSSKTRLISTFTAVIHNHDSRENLWKEIVAPVEAFIFYRFRSYSLETIQRDVPMSFHFGMKQVDLSLTELSLDVLLFSAGKLNLAGPYAVRSEVIFPNRCKVENLSGLTLLCHFDDNQEAMISRNESTYIFLRQRRVVEDQDLQNAISVSVQLVDPGTCSTTPIHISLLDTQVFAWRTRIVSQQDSRTYPGPFIVVDTSKTTEDGVSLLVSPLVRIHNASGFPMKIRFRRPQETEAESAFVLLPIGDTIDDSMAAFDALRLSGGSKKAVMSFGLGNFILSFRPELEEYLEKYKKPISVDWSEDITGGKAFHLTGIFDKLNYRFKRAFGVKSMKSSFSTVHCALSVEGQHISDVHFLIQTITRDVSISQPHDFGDTSDTEILPVALHKQKEIFVFPTVHVSNLLQSEIHVLLTETNPDLCTTTDCNLAGKQATIHCGSSTNLYANLSMMFFTVTLIEFNTKCKPVNSSDWVKKLQKQKDVHYLDIELKFAGGKYVAYLRLSRGERGILEATVFTSYTLQNGTDLTLFCCESNQKPLSRERVERSGAKLSPDLGCLLPPGSSRSWFLKSNKICIKLMEDKASVTSMDLDSLSGFTELCLESQDESSVKRFAKLGVSLKPRLPEAADLSLVLSMVPRHVVSNESEDRIFIHQCYSENDSDGSVAVDSEQKAALLFWKETLKRREISFFDSIFKHHRNRNEDSLLFIRFSLEEAGWSWSGPVCVASLGRFFLKFKRSAVSHGHEANGVNVPARQLTRYAAVTIVGEDSSLFLHFQMPLKFNLPYRIENCIRDSSVTYYQKDSSDMDTLESGKSVDYAWDDLNLPHKLVVQINHKNLSREINIDKVCAWNSFSKTRQSRVLALDTSFSKKSGQGKKTNFDESHGLGVLNVGYEVFPDGSTRVLRICYFAENYKEIKTMQPSLKIQFRVSSFAMHLLEKEKQDVGASFASTFSTIVVARLRNISLDSVFTDQHKLNQIRVQSLNVDEKWEGAPFSSMIRRSSIDHNDMIGNVLYIVFSLNSTVSKVKQVQHAAIVLQPIDLNIDEETLMRLVAFWRSSLSDSNIQSQQYYFKHFEIHPIKIIASFLPGAPYSSYSSAQEALRSLLHNVIKIPTVKNLVVELNGVLLTHALVTTRELIIKCAQHYSWYAMRAIYIAKGSSLLPPAFASIFDDSASSSLDVFFDPSSGLINFPGLTLGTFKFISKCINAKGVSGTKRYFGDLGQTMKRAGSNVLFAAITMISDNVVRGAETRGFSGTVSGFHQGILKFAMEPSLLGSAIMEGGPDRKIKLDRSPGADELYIEGYLQAMLDVMYKQEYLRVRLIHDQVLLKNLPPNGALINEIVEQVKSFLVSKELLKGGPSLISRPLPVHRSRVERDWKIGPTLLTLCEHLFVSFAIRFLRKQAARYTSGIKWKRKSEGEHEEIALASSKEKQEPLGLRWGIGKFLLSGLVAYVDGRLCRSIPNAIVRRIVSGFLLSFLEKDDDK